MKICSFSVDDWRCDIQIEEHSDCFELMVAQNRPVGVVPRTPVMTKENLKDGSYVKAITSQLDFLSDCDREPIGLGFDGKVYREKTLGALLSRVYEIKEAGYRVPHILISSLNANVKTVAAHMKSFNGSQMRG